MVVEPSGRVPPSRLRGRNSSQYAGWPARQLGHVPQLVKVSSTLSPGATVVTAEPTASTTPAPSWPSTPGNGNGMCPACTPMSVPHTPAATTRTTTSSGRGSSTVTSCRANGWPVAGRTAAVAVVLIGVPFLRWAVSPAGSAATVAGQLAGGAGGRGGRGRGSAGRRESDPAETLEASASISVQQLVQPGRGLRPPPSI